MFHIHFGRTVGVSRVVLVDSILSEWYRCITWTMWILTKGVNHKIIGGRLIIEGEIAMRAKQR